MIQYAVAVDQSFTIDVTETLSDLAVSFADDQNPGETQDLLLTGTITATVEQLTDAAMTVNLNIEDVTGGVMVWFNYGVGATQGPGIGQETLNINGYVYHSEYGRVSITTNPNSALGDDYVIPDGAVGSLVREFGNDNPVSGGFLIEGAAGHAAVIHVLSIQDGADTDGYEVVVDDAAPLGTFDDADTRTGPHAWD